MQPRTSKRELTEKLYGYLAEDEDARVCKDIPDEACDTQPKAFVYHLIALSLTKLGDALVSARLVLPWMLSALGAPSAFISALVPLRESLALLPQLIIAQQLRQTPLRKWFWVFGSVGQALALLGMLVSVLVLREQALGWAVVLLLTLFSIARGVCSVASKDVQGKTVSKTRRGRLSGLAATIAGSLSVLTALVVLFAPQLFPASLNDGDGLLFAALLGLGCILWLGAAFVYAQIPEIPGATSGGGNAIVEALKSLQLLWREPAFGHFVLTRALLVSSAFAIPFIVIMIQRSGDAGLTGLGGLMLASGLAGMLAGRFWGRWSDRASHQVMAAAAALAVIDMAAVLALFLWAPQWLAQSWLAAALIFVAAVAHHGARVGRKTYLVDMATQENRAAYTAVSNTVIGVLLLFGIGLGAVDAYFGVEAVMLVLIGLGSAAAVQALKLANVQQN